LTEGKCTLVGRVWIAIDLNGRMNDCICSDFLFIWKNEVRYIHGCHHPVMLKRLHRELVGCENPAGNGLQQCFLMSCYAVFVCGSSFSVGLIPNHMMSLNAKRHRVYCIKGDASTLMQIMSSVPQRW
jgi:hypothetical protein